MNNTNTKIRFILLSFLILFFPVIEAKAQYTKLREVEGKERERILSKKKIKAILMDKTHATGLEYVKVEGPAVFKKTDFSGKKKMRGIDFSGCYLEKCNFNHSEMQESIFHEVTLGDNDHSRGGFPTFYSTDMTNASFEKIIINYKPYARMQFVSTNLTKANFRLIEHCWGLHFTECQLKDAHFISNNGRFSFSNSSLQGVCFENTNFENQDCHHYGYGILLTTFGKSQVDSTTKFIGCTGKVKLEEMDVSGVDFSSSPSLELELGKGVVIDDQTKFHQSQLQLLVKTDATVIQNGIVLTIPELLKIRQDPTPAEKTCFETEESSETAVDETLTKVAQIIDVLVNELSPEGKRKLANLLLSKI